MSPRREDRLRALGRLNVCALFLYFLGVLLIDFHQVVIGIPDCLQKFIKLGMNSLSIAMLSALDEERHSPGRKRGERMPLQSIAEHQPARRIGQENNERRWPRRRNADFGKPAFDIRGGHPSQREPIQAVPRSMGVRQCSLADRRSLEPVDPLRFGKDVRTERQYGGLK